MYKQFCKQHITSARLSGQQLYGLCPFHEDNKSSFSANIYSGLWMCHGCGVKGNIAQFAKRLGVEPPKQTYVYQDENGNPLSRVIRSYPKKFSQERFEGGEWVQGLNGTRRVLYRFPEILNEELVCIVEGEKDVDRLWSIGIAATCNPGGAGKWRDEFNQRLTGKEIIIIPDNDSQGHRHAKLVAKSLMSVTDKIKIVKLPNVPDKGDISDWLNDGHTKVELLEHFKCTSIVTAEELKATEAADEEIGVIPSELQDKLIHPALHIEPGFASFGVIQLIERKLSYSIVTSSGGVYNAEKIKDGLSTPPMTYPDLAGRWTQTDVSLTLAESVALLICKMREVISFEDERWYYVAALWCAGTYLFPAFPAFPYFQLTGEKGSGKTKVQDVFASVCFNAIKLIDPTPAVLFRVVQAIRPTLLIDEAERMNSEEARALQCILNAGYKSGSSVPRVEGDNHQLRFYDVFCPKSFSSIRSLGSVTEDRCVTAIMSRPPRGDPRQNKNVDPKDDEWGQIRSGFYRLPFTHADKVFQGLYGFTLPEWLSARDRELWLLVLWLGSSVDEDSDMGLFEDVLDLAHETVKSKGMNFETDILLSLLEEKLGDRESIQIRPGELVEQLEERLNRRVRPEWVGHRLKSLGFDRKHRDGRGHVYDIEAAQIREFRTRYSTDGDAGHTTNQHRGKVMT